LKRFAKEPLTGIAKPAGNRTGKEVKARTIHICGNRASGGLLRLKGFGAMAGSGPRNGMKTAREAALDSR